ncbi:PREDICTED: DNA damage-binding protein 1-like [Diuraphis noxia]|uniref:DNA damage-binding protein 1-like n=1 Tax=Diuraphis noxia TaxID=143948 RepID=UPI000763A0DC|nr:PREDICTED: DNA damage-binding protein 1-like [Diuraphis noxia]
MWAAVHFDADNSVDYVPSGWIRKNRIKLLSGWPKNDASLKNFRSNPHKQTRLLPIKIATHCSGGVSVIDGSNVDKDYIPINKDENTMLLKSGLLMVYSEVNYQSMDAEDIQNNKPGFFISPTQLNLIVAKLNCIEIYLINECGLLLLSEMELNGKIEIMKVFRPKNKNVDLVFVVTAEYNAMILEFTQASNKIEIMTKGHCNVFDHFGIATEFMAKIDPNAKIVMLKLFEQMFKIIPLDKEGELEVYSITMEETNVQDFDFLYGFTNPTIIIIHENIMGRNIKIKEIIVNFITCFENSKKYKSIEKEASMIIPVPEPLFGVIIIGENSIFYHDGSFNIIHLPIRQKIGIVCYTRVDIEGTRYLLGDHSGCLLMLFLKYEKTSNGKFKVTDLTLGYFGEISIPVSLTYLDNKVIYVASKFGDSQLIKLHYEFNQSGSHVAVLDQYLNLGPIVDMCLVDIDQRGQEQIVTCSGAYKDGSLRVINNGVGIQEIATIDLLGIKGIWSLSFNTKSDLDDTLVLSYVWHSKVLTFNDEEAEEIHVEGFESELQTFYCGKTLDNKMVQITTASVRLICMETKKLISEWKIPNYRNINAVSCNDRQAVCSSGYDLYYIEIGSQQIFQNKRITLEHEASCLDICSFKDKFGETIILLAIGLWTKTSIKVLKLPDFVELVNEPLCEGIVPRSISFVTLEDIHYLFCALGNGSLCYFYLNIETGELYKNGKIKLGYRPALIKKFQTTSSIFICSDYPIIIHSSNKNLIFTNVNSIKVNYLCMINTNNYPNSLILATDTALIIGVIDMEKKHHVRTIPLGESPRRIAYQGASKTFGITTIKKNIKDEIIIESVQPSASTRTQNISSAMGNRSLDVQQCSSREISLSDNDFNTEFDKSSMIILHHKTFEIHVYQLYSNEYALSIISTKLGNDPNTYYILGTAFMTDECQDSNEGRIVVFYYNSSLSKLTQISEKIVNGGCFSMVTFHDMLVATVNSSVQLYSWNHEKKLVLRCTQNNNSISQYIKTNGKYILCGDVMKSLALFKYKTDEINLEKIVTDDCLKWSSAIEIIDNDLFMGAENDKYLYVFFQEIGRFHLGDLVNVFKHGSSVMKQFENGYETQLSVQGSIFYGTISGALGFITKMSPKLFGFLSDLEMSLATVVHGTGMIPHHHQIELTKSNKGFYDGNLIKSFLKLPVNDMESVIKGLKGSYDCEFQKILGQTEIGIKDVTYLIEDLTRLY